MKGCGTFFLKYFAITIMYTMQLLISCRFFPVIQLYIPKISPIDFLPAGCLFCFGGKVLSFLAMGTMMRPREAQVKDL